MEDRDFSKYDSVFIIGNGFDLNLGLPTSYTDFLKSEEFEQLIQGGNKLCKHLKNKHDLQNWIDIENELAIYSSICSENTDSIDNHRFRIDFDTLSGGLTEYIKKINCDNVNKDSPAYHFLCDFAKLNNSLIIDFNYTKSSSNILRNDSHWNHSQIKERLIKIHGTAQNGIIFGVEDKAKIIRDHLFIKKAASRLYNREQIDLIEILNKAKELIFFGLSLGETDHSYFDYLFTTSSIDRTQDRKVFVFYYYGRGDYEITQQLDKLTANNLSLFKLRNKVTFRAVEFLRF